MAKEVEYIIQCIYLLQWFQVLLRSLPLLGLHLSTCNMATLYELELCLKSIWNIEKITKVSKCFPELNAHMWFIVMFQSMKIIASIRLAKAQHAIQSGKQYGIANFSMTMSFMCSRVPYVSLSLQRFSRILNLRRHLNINSLLLYPWTRVFVAAFTLPS